MSPQLFIGLLGTFVAAGVTAGSAANWMLLRFAPGTRRLRAMTGTTVVIDATPEDSLTDRLTWFEERAVRLIPKSPKELKQLRRRLARAGYRRAIAAVVFVAAEFVLPALLAIAALALLKGTQAFVFAAGGAAVGYLLPGVMLNRLIDSRRTAIANGLPDALDLLTVCLEAGYGLDLAIAKTGEELSLAHPALAEEFKLLTSETRAGKPRIEAFKGIEARTKNDEVRGLVAMLAQTDRFGTSVAQALRTLSATSRTKRRQRAEEKAAKVGSKMVFPLVLCLFPALYAVILGPAIVQITRVFLDGFMSIAGK
jgi:tight adherence protein C